MAVVETAGHPLVLRSQPWLALGREWRLAYALSLPVVLVIVGLIAYPLGYAVWLSFQNIKIGGQGTFIGFDNYAKVLWDSSARINSQFWDAVRVTLVYTGGAMAGKFVLGMTAALILN